MTKVILNRKISPRVLNGHPWVFANEVNLVKGEAAGGDIVDVHMHDDKFLGRGYYNPKSQILVRILTRNKAEEINEAFFLRKLSEAWKQRQQLGYTENCRLIFGEADGLSQLIIDKFNCPSIQYFWILFLHGSCWLIKRFV